MKNNPTTQQETRRKEVVSLRLKGLTFRQIMKKMGFKSTSVVSHHLYYAKKQHNWIEENFLFPERTPTANAKQSDVFMCVGFNAYRELIKEKISKGVI